MGPFVVELKRRNVFSSFLLGFAVLFFIGGCTADDPEPETTEPTIAETEGQAEDSTAAQTDSVFVEEVATYRQHTIAVLPFADLSAAGDQGWLADGFSEEILNSLARTPDLLVAARTSSFAFKNSEQAIADIAVSLGVAHLLQGSIRRDGEQLTVAVQLMRASDGFEVWSETFERPSAELIDVLETVALGTANALGTGTNRQKLAEMVSPGTQSVPAFESYLRGLAYGVSTIQTGDTQLFLSARDAFERAVEIDPAFSKPYWELAQFWSDQLSTTNIIAGTTGLDRSEMWTLYDAAIAKAIELETDPADQVKYRAYDASNKQEYEQALALNTEYLTQRPLDPEAHIEQLDLLGRIGTNEEIIEAVRYFDEVDGHDLIVTQLSITRLVYAGDMDYLREYVEQSLERFPTEPFMHYQAHRALAWAGDVDRSARIAPLILSSELPNESRFLVMLRQACAEKRLDDANRIYQRGLEQFPDDHSINWIAHKIMGDDEAAKDALMSLDNADDISGIADFMTYGTFNARHYPNLMAFLEGKGIEPREPIDVAYRCDR